jgi:hypothetical protein
MVAVVPGGFPIWNAREEEILFILFEEDFINQQ